MKVVINFTEKFTRWKWFVFPTPMYTGLYKIFSDKGELLKKFEIVSGGWGRRPIDAGVWRIGDIVSNDTLDKFYQGEKRKWYARLIPMFQTDQTGILLHPDQPPKGTKGCVSPDVGPDEDMYQSLERGTIVEVHHNIKQ